MGRKGLSADDKREKMITAISNSKSVFNMKELEKIGKEQGISPMIIKDVIQSLVDDDLLTSEKLKNKIEDYQKRIDTLKSEVQQMEQQIVTEKETKQETDERVAKLQLYAQLSEKHEELQKEIGSLRERDPETVSNMKQSVKDAVEGANRWTDNLWSLKSHITRKYGYASKDVDHMLEIPEDFDYIDMPTL